MPLELKPNSRYWYGRIQVNGKREFISLEIPIRGRRPKSLREEGDPPFEKSRAVAQVKLEQIEGALRQVRTEQLIAHRLAGRGLKGGAPCRSN